MNEATHKQACSVLYGSEGRCTCGADWTGDGCSALRLHPYGVEVGDVVHYWPGNPPPLSQTYVAPPCQNALILGFTWDERSIWLAHLAVVDKRGAVRILTAVPQAESSTQTGLANGALSERSFGTPASWHRAHDESEA